VAVLFYGQDDVSFESVTENFANLGKSGFDFFPDGGSDFVVTSGVFHVHEAALLCPDPTM
jgi:hypothetical protein